MSAEQLEEMEEEEEEGEEATVEENAARSGFIHDSLTK